MRNSKSDKPRFVIVRANLAREHADAIVTPAHRLPQIGCGADRAVHAAAADAGKRRGSCASQAMFSTPVSRATPSFFRRSAHRSGTRPVFPMNSSATDS